MRQVFFLRRCFLIWLKYFVNKFRVVLPIINVTYSNLRKGWKKVERRWIVIKFNAFNLTHRDDCAGSHVCFGENNGGSSVEVSCREPIASFPKYSTPFSRSTLTNSSGDWYWLLFFLLKRFLKNFILCSSNLLFHNTPAAVARDIVKPPLSVEFRVLSGAEVGEDGKLRICERVARIGNAGKLRIVGADCVSKGNKIFLSHIKRRVEDWFLFWTGRSEIEKWWAVNKEI